MKAIQDFKQKAKERGIVRWIIHYCSMCGYPCGFIIQGDQLIENKYKLLKLK